MKEYFKLIEQKRQQKGISIEKLCKIVGISHMTYHDAKACKHSIATDKFIKLCKAVGITYINLD